MPQRINGSVYTDQTLSGSLKHYLLVGADFKNSFSDKSPAAGSAAEEIVRVITQNATIVIFNPFSIGISFALESNRANWNTSDLEIAIRELGNTVGYDNLNLSNIRLNEVEYNFFGSEYVYVVPDPNISTLSVNNTYFITASSTITLPDYTDSIIDIGSLIRLFKYEDTEVTITTFGDQLIRDTTQNTTSTSYTYNYNEEIVIVFDGIQWAIYRDDNETIDSVIGLQDELDSKQSLIEKGEPNGYTPLNEAGLVPSDYLPSFVDDVLEYPMLTDFPEFGETGKIYVDISNGRIYRWSGSVYIEVSSRPPSTNEVPEGTSNQYFTIPRARASLSAGLDLSYDTATGIFSLDQFSDYIELDPMQTTASVVYVTACTLNVAIPTTGMYDISWNMEVSNSHKFTGVHVRVQLDDAITFSESIHVRENDSTEEEYSNISGFRRYNLTSGSHFIDVDYRTNANLGQIRRIRVLLTRVS